MTKCDDGREMLENPWASYLLPAPMHPESNKSSRVRAIDLASMFEFTEDQFELALIRACAQGSIAAWAGKALFIEGDISHREVNWPIPIEAWASRNAPSSRNAHYGDFNPAFSVRDGTLRGYGFSPVVIMSPDARVVENSAIEFQLSRIEFDGDDLAYHMEALGFSNSERLQCTRKGALPSCATSSNRRHEKAAHDAVAHVREGKTVAAAIREVIDQVDPKGRTPDSVGRAIREAYNLMYDLRGNPHPE